MIQNMQKPIYYHGFDVAVMDLRTFISVSGWCQWCFGRKWNDGFLFSAMQKGHHLLYDVQDYYIQYLKKYVLW